jgi:hypothetical protein
MADCHRPLITCQLTLQYRAFASNVAALADAMAESGCAGTKHVPSPLHLQRVAFPRAALGLRLAYLHLRTSTICPPTVKSANNRRSRNYVEMSPVTGSGRTLLLPLS